MSRDRLSWKARRRQAERRKNADPYTMNQDRTHVPTEDYMIGDPAVWAEEPVDDLEDLDGTERNELGMPDMLDTTHDHKDVDAWNSGDAYDNGDTFGPGDKLDGREAKVRLAKMQRHFEKKALQCVRIAQAILPQAGDDVIAEQALDLMPLPDDAVVATSLRLSELLERIAEEDAEEGDDEGGEDKEASLSPDEMLRVMMAEEEGDDEDADEDEAKDASDDDDDDEDDEGEGKEASVRQMVAEELAKLFGQPKVAEEDEDEEEDEAKDASDDDEEDEAKDASDDEDDEDEEESKESSVREAIAQELARMFGQQPKVAEDDEEDEDDAEEDEAKDASDDEDADEDDEDADKESMLADLMAEAGIDLQANPVLQQTLRDMQRRSEEDEDDEDMDADACGDMGMDMGDDIAADEMLDEDLDAMLNDMDHGAGASEASEIGIDLEPSLDNLDAEALLEEDDATLQALMNRHYSVDGQQGKKASKGSKGVSQLGRVKEASSTGDDGLSKLWDSAPDVSKVFGN